MSDQLKPEIAEEDIELPDMQSVDLSVSDDASETRPIPAGIKWMFAGIVVACLIASVGLYAYANQSQPSTDAVVAIDEGDSDQKVATDALIARLESAKPTEKKNKTADLSSEPVTKQEKMSERMVSLEAQIVQLIQQVHDLALQEQGVSQMKTEVGQMADHLKTLPSQDDLATMRQDFDEMLQITIKDIKNTPARIHKKENMVRKKKSYARLPFKLVSIDQWDGVNYAAIQSTNIGAIENLRSGDTRSGWTVERIDSIESSVQFKHVKTGRSIKQTAI